MRRKKPIKPVLWPKLWLVCSRNFSSPQWSLTCCECFTQTLKHRGTSWNSCNKWRDGRSAEDVLVHRKTKLLKSKHWASPRQRELWENQITRIHVKELKKILSICHQQRLHELTGRKMADKIYWKVYWNQKYSESMKYNVLSQFVVGMTHK